MSILVGLFEYGNETYSRWKNDGKKAKKSKKRSRTVVVIEVVEEF